jgi:hypothetical protein
MTHPTYILSAIADGYRFECACGELSNSYAAADACRKCRVYVGHVHADPVELTGDFAADNAARDAVEQPSEAEIQAYAVAWQAARDAEKAAELKAFRAKVASLGLDPEKYAYLA